MAGGDKGRVLCPVAFEGDAGPVVAPAIGLDHEAVGREEEVGVGDDAENRLGRLLLQNHRAQR